MRIDQTDDRQHVLTVTGDVGATEAHALAARLIAAVDDGGDHDVILDMREVTAFDDAVLPALTAGRARAKYLHHRIVVLDDDGGAITRSLHRSGQALRFPVYADVAAAGAGLAEDRRALDHRNQRDPSIPEDAVPSRG